VRLADVAARDGRAAGKVLGELGGGAAPADGVIRLVGLVAAGPEPIAVGAVGEPDPSREGAPGRDLEVVGQVRAPEDQTVGSPGEAAVDWNLRRIRNGRREDQTPYGLARLKLPRLSFWEFLKLTPEELRKGLFARGDAP
jgi:hypothetical protein